MQQTGQIIQQIERERMVVGLRNDGVVHVYYKDHTVIDLPLQNELIEVVRELCRGERMLYIFEAGHKCSLNKAARDNAIAMEDQVPAIATVVFAPNMVYKMIANFYYKFNKPRMPYNVFTDFDAGVAWLHEQKALYDKDRP